MLQAPIPAVTALALCTLAASAGDALLPQATVAAGPPMRIEVPTGTGAPVITDGLFSSGEWDDALRVEVTADVTLYLKEYRGVVFVGVRGQGPLGVGPSELSLATPHGPIRKLHVSAALYEVLLPADDAPEPRPRMGLTADWYANELRRDDDEVARLQNEGTKNPMEIIKATSYPADGIEFAIRRSKFPGGAWLMRLWATGFFGGKPGAITFPPAVAERATDGWLELRLK